MVTGGGAGAAAGGGADAGLSEAEIASLMEGLTAILQDPRICKKNPDETQKFKLLSEYAGYVALFL